MLGSCIRWNGELPVTLFGFFLRLGVAVIDQAALIRSVDGIRTTNSSGKPVLALLILAYWTETTEPALLRRE